MVRVVLAPIRPWGNTILLEVGGAGWGAPIDMVTLWELAGIAGYNSDAAPLILMI